MTLGPYLAYHDLVLSLRPDLYWPLDRLYKASDISGGRKDGSAGGGALLGQFATPPGGISNVPGAEGATNFDGADDKITSSYAHFANGTTRTFAGWAWIDAGTAGARVLVGASFSNSNRIWVNATSRNCTFNGDTATVNIDWLAAWPGFDQWVHWALVYNETTDQASLYLNGALVSTQTAAGSWAATGNMIVGSDDVNPWDGKMAHFAVFARGLTAGEIASLYKAGAPGS